MASTVNAAIANFITQLKASTDLAGVTVYDGPPATAETPEWIAVGYQSGATEAVMMSWDWTTFGAQRSEETFGVLCSFAVTSGDANIPARRTRAIAIRDGIAAVVTADRTLAGAVRLAQLSDGVMHQAQTGRGMSVRFTFTLSCVARITT